MIVIDLQYFEIKDTENYFKSELELASLISNPSQSMEAEGFLVTRVIDEGVGMSLNNFKSSINVIQFGDRRESKFRS